MNTRKSIAALTADEKNAYVAGVKRLKESGQYDTYVTTHYNAMTQKMTAHRRPNFLPWHREFLLRLERDIQNALEKPEFALPYWDWAADAATGDPASAVVWREDFMGGNGAANTDVVDSGPFAGASNWPLNIRSDGTTSQPPGNLTRHFGGASGLPTQQLVNNALSISVYDTKDWNWNSAGSFRNALENLHNSVHNWVGGAMLPATSPNDPVFFLHHCNVDRLWAQWQAMYPNSPYLPTSGGPSWSNLNDGMWPWDTAPDIRTPANELNFWDLGFEYDTVLAPPAADFRATTIQTRRLNVVPGPNFEYNVAYGGSWRILQAGGYFDVNFDLAAVDAAASLNLLHLTSSLWPNPGYSPIDITVNGQVFKKDYDVGASHNGSREYENDAFPASAVLKTGTNNVRVTLQPGASTHYWIRTLTVAR